MLTYILYIYEYLIIYFKLKAAIFAKIEVHADFFHFYISLKQNVREINPLLEKIFCQFTFQFVHMCKTKL